MSAARLQIRDWQNHCFVSRSHPAPERARAEVDRLADRLSGELAAALARAPDGHGDGVVLVRRLDFDCALDLAGDPGLLANRCVAQFVRALAATIETGDGVLRFPSVAAWRARFLADVVTGGSRQAWYYRAFDGLQSLPDAALVRTLLIEGTALGCATLVALPQWAWPAMSALLTRGEALRILAGLARQPGGDGLATSSLQPFAAAAAGLVHGGANGPVRGLAMFAEALRGGLAPTRALAAWSLLAGELAASSADDGAEKPEAALLQASAAAASPAERDLLEAARRLLTTHPEWRQQWNRARGARAATGHESSDFAGLALLLPELESLLDPRLCAGLPVCRDANPRNLLAWLGLAHCAGGMRAPRFVREGFWRGFFDVAPRIGLPELLAWLDSTSAAPTLALLAERAATLACGAMQDAPLRAGEQRCWLRIDVTTGIWCQWTDESAATTPPRRASLSAARRARRDWQYLSFDWGLPRAWQQVFVWLAQVAMRRFAWRLPGFAGSSLPWVHANFLTGTGHGDETGRLRLARPPLHALLRLTGISRSAIVWSGPPARQLLPEHRR